MSTHYNKDGDTDWIDCRERLYWNKFTYKARISLPNGARLRPDDILATFISRMDYYYRSERSKKFIKDNPGIYERYYAWRQSVPKDVQMAVRSEAGQTTFFCNDLELLKTLRTVHDSLITTKVVVVTAARIMGIKFFRTQPKHKYRIYMRSKRVETAEYTKFTAFLREHSDKFTMSPAMKTSLYDHRNGYRTRWMSGAYFIDYDVRSLESWLHLMWDDMLGKHYELKQYDTGKDYIDMVKQGEEDVVE